MFISTTTGIAFVNPESLLSDAEQFPLSMQSVRALSVIRRLQMGGYREIIFLCPRSLTEHHTVLERLNDFSLCNEPDVQGKTRSLYMMSPFFNAGAEAQNVLFWKAMMMQQILLAWQNVGRVAILDPQCGELGDLLKHKGIPLLCECDFYGVSSAQLLLQSPTFNTIIQEFRQSQKEESAKKSPLGIAKDALKALAEESFVATELGYGEVEKDNYHNRHWQALLEAVGLTEVFCSLCGHWYEPTVRHTCAF